MTLVMLANGKKLLEKRLRQGKSVDFKDYKHGKA